MADFDMVTYDHYIRKGLSPSEAMDKAMDKAMGKGKSSGKQKSTKHSSSGYGYDEHQPSSHRHHRDSYSSHRHGSSSRHEGGYEYDPYSGMAGGMGGMPFPGMSSSGDRHYGEDRSHRKHKSSKHGKYKHKESSSSFSGILYDDIFSKLAEDVGGLGLGIHKDKTGDVRYAYFGNDEEEYRRAKPRHDKSSSRKHRVEDPEPEGYSYGYGTFSGPECTKTHTFGNPPGGDFFGAGGPFGGSGSGFGSGYGPGFGSGYGPGYGSDFDFNSRHHGHRGKSHTTSGRADKEPTFNYGTKPEQCLYKTLGVSRTASSSELRDGHRKLSLKYHPDRAPKGKMSEYTKKMADINSAYDALTSGKVREMYDSTGRVIPENFYTDFQIYLSHKEKYDRG